MTQIASAAIIMIGMVYLLGTVVLSRRKQPVPQAGEEPDLFVFVVPCLDEEQVVGATVANLLDVGDHRARVLVIDDGSSDGTADIVRSFDDPRVWLLERTAPNARRGKGQALNHAYQRVRADVEHLGIDPRRVVLCIIDADGRLQPDVLHRVGPYFRDRRVGAVQLLVRIRNRETWLGRFQDYEFLVFSHLTQTAREHVGSVGLGGNGQFTRLAALSDLGDDPWSDCLTEDLDLGVRLAVGGWRNRFCGETWVDQQGLTDVPRLLRQRTRWAHGHFQCWKLIPAIVRSPLPTVTVLDLAYYLLAPALVLLSSMMFTAAIAWLGYAVVAEPSVWLSATGMVYLAVIYVVSLGPAIALALLYQRRSQDLSLPRAFAMGHLLPLYNYVWYAAEWKALGRIVMQRRGWDKTARLDEQHLVTTAPTES